jgi:hypothetical protein
LPSLHSCGEIDPVELPARAWDGFPRRWNVIHHHRCGVRAAHLIVLLTCIDVFCSGSDCVLRELDYCECGGGRMADETTGNTG